MKLSSSKRNVCSIYHVMPARRSIAFNCSPLLSVFRKCQNMSLSTVSVLVFARSAWHEEVGYSEAFSRAASWAGCAFSIGEYLHQAGCGWIEASAGHVASRPPRPAVIESQRRAIDFPRSVSKLQISSTSNTAPGKHATKRCVAGLSASPTVLQRISPLSAMRTGFVCAFLPTLDS